MADQVLDLTPFNRELDRFDRALTDAEITGMVRYVAGRVGVKAEALTRVVPPQSGKALPAFYTRTRKLPDGTSETYKSKFKSLKQQRLVMALAAQGKVPRKRSGKLVQSITSEVLDAGPDGATVAVGTNRTEAPYVVGSQQSHYHAGNWILLDDLLVRGQDALMQTAQSSFFAAVEKRIGGK